MHRVEDCEPLDAQRVGHRHRPGDTATEIVPDDECPLAAEGIEDRDDVLYDAQHGVGIHPVGAIRRSVAAQVGRDGEVTRLRERGKDPAPRGPMRGKTVEEEDEGTFGWPTGYTSKANAAAPNRALDKPSGTERGGHGRGVPSKLS